MDNAVLVAAARFERDRRATSYPERIRTGGLDPEAASIDYQCWVAIAEWLECEAQPVRGTGEQRTGRTFTMINFPGGAEPERDDAPIVGWPELEAAAEAAVASVAASVAKQESDPNGNADRLAELYVRRARLFVIHRKVRLRRQSIDEINARLRVGPKAAVTA